MKEFPRVLPSGYCLRHYRIESVLGSGGFGVTYQAVHVHEALPIRYAIKEYLPREGAERGPDGITVQPNADGRLSTEPGKPTYYEWGLKRFLDEARTLAAIQHPYVARVQDFFEANGTAYLVMQYEDGEPLSAVLARQKTLPEARIRRLLEEVLGALEAVHAKGYLHRDIKPHNLYVRAQDGSTLLIDFGAARQVLGAYTGDITCMGTLGYTPPEQYGTQADAYGPWTDLYALGAVLYQCITGERPMDAQRRKRGQPWVPAVETGAGRYSKELLRVVDRALALRPEERFQSAAQMRAALTLPPVGSGWRKWALAGGLLLVAGAAALVTRNMGNPLQPGRIFQDSLAGGSKGPEVVVIAAGEFQMGSPLSEAERDTDERPHRVVIEKPFAIGKSEVTVGEFRRFVEATDYRTEAERGRGCFSWSGGKWENNAGYSWRNPGFEQNDHHPVVCLSWHDALAYTDWLTRQTGQGYRLPTEAEWEYAARAGIPTAYWWGDKIGKNNTNCVTCGSRWDGQGTAPVGSFAASPFTLNDTAGNVWEWTCSEYAADYAGAETRCVGNDSAGTQRSVRGGSWANVPRGVRAATRGQLAPDSGYGNVGFRLVRTLG